MSGIEAQTKAPQQERDIPAITSKLENCNRRLSLAIDRIDDLNGRAYNCQANSLADSPTTASGISIEALSTEADRYSDILGRLNCALDQAEKII